MAKKIQNKDKKKAWTECSRYVRIKRCLETTGLPFVGYCITCKRKFHISNLQAGHLFSGRGDSGNATLYSTKFIYNQCSYCNVLQHGEHTKYLKAIEQKYGKDYCERWKWRLKAKIIPDNVIDWEKKIAQYKRRYGVIMHKFGFKTYLELLQTKG